MRAKLKNIDLELVEKYAIVGLPEKDIAFLLDVHPTTLTRNKKKHEEIAIAIKKGRLTSEVAMSTSLFEKGQAGNVTAMIFWLCNRCWERWKDVHQIVIETKEKDRIDTLTPKEVEEAFAKIAR